MNKKLKMLTTALLLSGSLLSVVPANAATVSATTKKATIDNKVSKQSGNITVKSGETTTVNAYNVAIRKRPGLSSTVLERLNPGDKITYVDGYSSVYKDGYDWVYVGYHSSSGTIFGYIAQQYIE